MRLKIDTVEFVEVIFDDNIVNNIPEHMDDIVKIGSVKLYDSDRNLLNVNTNSYITNDDYNNVDGNGEQDIINFFLQKKFGISAVLKLFLNKVILAKSIFIKKYSIGETQHRRNTYMGNNVEYPKNKRYLSESMIRIFMEGIQKFKKIAIIQPSAIDYLQSLNSEEMFNTVMSDKAKELYNKNAVLGTRDSSCSTAV